MITTYNIQEKRKAEHELKMKMINYLEKEKRLEFLTLNTSEKEKKQIYKDFIKLIPHLLYKERFGKVEYFLVNVDYQHLHIVISKPWVMTKILVHTWQKISNQKNLMIKTIKNNEENYMRVADYIISQPDKHSTTNVHWIESENFGIVIKEKKIKKEAKIKQKVEYDTEFEKEIDYIKQIKDNPDYKPEFPLKIQSIQQIPQTPTNTLHERL